ncbi:hypothetical protein NC651_024986 [Populus alba x Populus x berolinensis]|nr:hypothetical protein NC651_024986 [Populus alba x Populus x berolinensis]
MQQLKDVRMDDGCALLDFHITRSMAGNSKNDKGSKEKHQPIFNKNKSILRGRKIQESDPEGSSTEIPVKLCNNNSEIPGSKDLVLRVDTTTNHLKGIRIWDGDTQVDFLIVESEDQGVKEPNVQQKPHAGRAAAYVQQEQHSIDTYNDVMVNDIREEMGPIEFNHLASSWMKFR